MFEHGRFQQTPKYQNTDSFKSSVILYLDLDVLDTLDDLPKFLQWISAPSAALWSKRDPSPLGSAMVHSAFSAKVPNMTLTSDFEQNTLYTKNASHP